MGMAIEIHQLSKTFADGFWLKQKQILKGLSFSVREGTTTGFVGTNGSGKTTSLKCILGFLKPNSGEIKIFGKKDLSNEVRLSLGYLPERPYYYEFLTAKEFLRFHWNLSGGGAGFADAAQKALERVRLVNVNEKRLRQFSKGMLQRIGMAQALLRGPRLLILDEPMSGLDPDGRLMMKEIIREEQRRGTTLFFSSHLLGDMEELCEDVVVINKGEILYQGPLAKLAFSSEINFRISFAALNGKNIQEVLVSKNELQNKIDEIRSSKNEILKIVPSQAGLEGAFQDLLQKGIVKP